MCLRLKIFLGPAGRIKLLVEEKGWSQQKAATYFGKAQPWVNHYINIPKNLDSALITQVINLDDQDLGEFIVEFLVKVGI